MADLTQLKLSLTLDRENRKGKQICIYFMSRSLKTISGLLLRLKKIFFCFVTDLDPNFFFSFRIAKKNLLNLFFSATVFYQLSS